MPRQTRPFRIEDVMSALGRLADPALAQEWDNVGLIAGDERAICSGAILCVDMTDAVVEEAVAAGTNMVVAYHPPIFAPIKRLRASSRETDAGVLRALHRRLHIYAMHTALDAAEGGTNDILARLCGIQRTEPFEDVPAGPFGLKVVVFVPPAEVDRVAEAMFAAGAGRIGHYEKCSFRLRGTGTFFGTDEADPTVGRRGRLEHVDEVRLEAVVDPPSVAGVLQAIRRAHSYEEPAIDVYPLNPTRMRPGIGRIGTLPRPTTLGRLAGRLGKAVGAPAVRIIGRASQAVRRVAICAGSAGRLPDRSLRTADCDALVTGEVGHHDALHWIRRRTGDRTGFGVIALGHWHSERPVLESVAEVLGTALPGLPVVISRQDRDPFTWASPSRAIHPAQSTSPTGESGR